MRRTVAVIWHASFSVIAAGLYVGFVLPRWWELTGATSHTLGTVLRIVAAVLIGLAALPVVFTLLRTRKPEYGTPQLALTLLISSVVAHVLAGVLIAGTAISEIWLSLDAAGPWLFGIYGAAAAIALLGIGAFYLSFVAEMPPPPPKPLKPKKAKKPKQRRKGKGSDDDAEAAEPEADGAESEADAAEDEADAAEDEDEADAETAESEVTAEVDEVTETVATAAAAETVEAAVTTEAAEAAETVAAAEGEDEAAAPTVVDSDSPDPELARAEDQRKLWPTGKRRTRNRG